MEFYQQVQQRTAQTVPVMNNYAPTLKIEGQGAVELGALSGALNGQAQERDDAIFGSDEAIRAEFRNFLQTRLLGIKIPALIEALLGDDEGLVDSLDATYAINPRTPEAAVERARALRPVWVQANESRAAMNPPQPPITRNELDLAALDALLFSQPGLAQGVENKAAAVKGKRSTLRLAAVQLDKLNKRAYKGLVALADPDTAFENALTGIVTESANLPETLSIAKVLQEGADQLHVLVSYDAGTYDETFTSTVEWLLAGTETDFTHNVKADPSGNALGPFAVGQTVKIRTRTTNGNGTTTGGIRTLTMAAPVG